MPAQMIIPNLLSDHYMFTYLFKQSEHVYLFKLVYVIVVPWLIVVYDICTMSAAICSGVARVFTLV